LVDRRDDPVPERGTVAMPLAAAHAAKLVEASTDFVVIYSHNER
jgi:hypothetical protein